MVPGGVDDEPQAGTSGAGIGGKVLRSRAARARDGAGKEEVQEGEGEGQERRGRRGRRPKGAATSSLDKGEQIKRRVKYLLLKIRTDRNLLEVYSRDGWKGQSREKIRPEQELRRAEAQILRSKLAIREALHELDDLGLEGSLDEHLFDDEGRIYHEEIFCAKCKSEEALLENDIILCDGACNRGFHQFCLDPPLETKDIPPGDEGWLCPVCDCKMECVEAINADLGTKYEVENGWKEFFSKEAAGGGSQEGGELSSDSEDDDYDPEDSEDSPEPAGAGVTTMGIDEDWPSTDAEDDDFDPERGEKQGNSEEESESQEVGDDEKREDGADSDDSDSDFRENEASSCLDDEEPIDKDEKVSSVGHINLKKLARKGKRRRSSSGSHEENESSPPSDSDASDVSLFDEFKDGGAKLGRRDSQAEASTADEDAMVIEGKRHRKALDYKKLHDEMYGNTAADDDDVASEDEDWGPKRRRRGSIPNDPSRPRPPRVRRRKSKASSGEPSKGADVGASKGADPDASLEADVDASKRASQEPCADASMGVDADTPKGVDADPSMGVNADTSKGVDADTSKGVDADTSKGVDADTSKGVDADTSKGVDADTSTGVDADAFKAGASKEVVTNVAPISMPFQSQGGDGGADTPGVDREKRMWRRLPDAAVEGLRREVAVTTLPSKPRKEELAAELGLTFTQVHGWFKNQRHQALRKGIEKPKRPHLVASSSKGVVVHDAAVDGVETSASHAAATEITNEKSSSTILTDEQARVLELKQTLDVFDKDSVLIVDAEGRTMELGISFANGGIGLPANGNLVVYAPAPIEVREQLPHVTYPY